MIFNIFTRTIGLLLKDTSPKILTDVSGVLKWEIIVHRFDDFMGRRYVYWFRESLDVRTTASLI